MVKETSFMSSPIMLDGEAMSAKLSRKHPQEINDPNFHFSH